MFFIFSYFFTAFSHIVLLKFVLIIAQISKKDFVNFKQDTLIDLVFPLLTLNKLGFAEKGHLARS